MTPTGSSRFRHSPLPNSSNHIRLLELLELDENETISVCCQLSTFALEDAPRYCAISYTWGSEDNTALIIVNNEHMEVRQNCEYVLKQSRWYSNSKWLSVGRRRYFWCDAICIDQTNHSEKSFQVAMMGKIFEQAEEVLCCIGEHDADSERIMSMLQSKSPFLTAVVASRKLSFMRRLVPSSLAFRGYRISGDFRKMCHRHWTRRYDTLEPMRLIKSRPGPQPLFTPDRAATARMRRRMRRPAFIDPIIAFAKRAYFNRAWVYQELCFGSNVIVCCGGDRVSLDRLRELVDYAGNLPDYEGMGGGYGVGHYGDEFGAAIDLVEAGVTKTKVSGWAEALLARHLSRVSQLDCTDDRDRVYAILSLIPWAETATPIFVRVPYDCTPLLLDVGQTD